MRTADYRNAIRVLDRAERYGTIPWEHPRAPDKGTARRQIRRMTDPHCAPIKRRVYQ